MMDTPTKTSSNENPLLFFVMFVTVFASFIIAPPLKHWQTLAGCTTALVITLLRRYVIKKTEILIFFLIQCPIYETLN